MGSLTTILKIVDPLVIVAAALVSYWLRFDTFELPLEYQVLVVVAFALAILIFAVTDVYRGQPDESLGRNLVQLFAAWIGVVALVVALIYGTQRGLWFSRQWLGVWSVMALVALFAVRVGYVALLGVLHRRGLFTRKVAIAGAGELGRQIARRLSSTPSTGLKVVAFYDDNPALAGQTILGVPVRGDVDTLKETIPRGGIDQLWIALPLRAEERVKQLLDEVGRYNVEVRFVPDIFSFRLLNHSVAEIGGLPVIKITDSPLAGPKRVLKWIEDKLIAGSILLVLFPLLVLIAIGVKLSSPGPVFFKQRRGGLDNREFLVWKFRTMYVHNEAEAQQLVVPGDPRVTRFGAFLRRTSLDELPQFINVMLGDMSVVGPRPHPIWVHNLYAERLPTYLLRTWIKPGITGWAQICGWRGDLSEDWKMEMRIQHDLYYLENWSLGFDLYIILMTPFRMWGERVY